MIFFNIIYYNTFLAFYYFNFIYVLVLATCYICFTSFYYYILFLYFAISLSIILGPYSGAISYYYLAIALFAYLFKYEIKYYLNILIYANKVIIIIYIFGYFYI